MLLVAAPAPLKGVLDAARAAAALAEGARSEGAEALELPVADGGEGTAAALQAVLGGEWHAAEVSGPLGRPVRARWLALGDGTAVVESAAAIGLPLVAPHERDPLRATSRGLGELLLAVLAERPAALLVGLGGSATVDGGAGMREVVGDALAGIAVEALCDVRTRLLDAPRVFGPQKGASPRDVRALEARLAADEALRPYAGVPGSGAAGGLGAAFASLGARLVPGAPRVLDLLGFDARVAGADAVVTGEGAVDATTFEGKAPGEVAARCRAAGVPCVVFGGLVADGLDARRLSGDPGSARDDLVALGAAVARRDFRIRGV